MGFAKRAAVTVFVAAVGTAPGETVPGRPDEQLADF